MGNHLRETELDNVKSAPRSTTGHLAWIVLGLIAGFPGSKAVVGAVVVLLVFHAIGTAA